MDALFDDPTFMALSPIQMIEYLLRFNMSQPDPIPELTSVLSDFHRGLHKTSYKQLLQNTTAFSCTTPSETLLTLLQAHKYMAVSTSQKRKFVVLSLGTGVANKTGAYDAREMTGWGLFRWYWNITWAEMKLKWTSEMDISTSENMNCLADVEGEC
ncbi:hypothetical protein Tco_1463365 [Tanacetum coccineum]